MLGLMWAAAHLQMLMGSDSLAIRYLLTLGIGYLGYLVVLRVWAATLVRRESVGLDFIGEIPMPDVGGSINSSSPATNTVFQSGGGGDFGGGGADGDFSGVVESSDSVGDVVSGALDVAAGSDEGAVVVVPVVAVFLVGVALLFGAGSLLLLYFGWDALLAVAVELAFSYVSARTAIRVVRQGWLSAAVRLTWKPLLGALVCATMLGATLDYFVPAAKSLPHAIKLIKAS